MAAGIAVFHSHEEVELVYTLAGAWAAILDKRYLQAYCKVHDHVADNSTAPAGGY